jgi:hypothetical protein
LGRDRTQSTASTRPGRSGTSDRPDKAGPRQGLAPGSTSTAKTRHFVLVHGPARLARI